MPRRLHVLSLCAVAALGGCETTLRSTGVRSATGYRSLIYVPDLPVSEPPFDEVDASWKQRLDVPYVYLEHYGSYRDTGALIPSLFRELRTQGLEPDGPPFALFYDDPATVVVDELRSRACIPIRGARAVLAPLGYEVLRSTTVVYAFASGPYPDAPRAYPGVLAFLERMSWERTGPVREIYLVPPGRDPEAGALLCEIQMPAGPPPGLR